MRLFRPVIFRPLAPLLFTWMVCTGAGAHEYNEIGQLLRAGKLAEAQSRVEALLQSQPRDAQLRLYKGVIQRETGHPNDALQTFTRLSEEHPELPEPYNNAAVIYAAQGQYDKARIALEKALHTNPSYAVAHDNLTDVYARLASQAYSKALQIEAPANAAPTRLALLQEVGPGAINPDRWTARPNTTTVATANPATPPAPSPPAANAAPKTTVPAPAVAAPATAAVKTPSAPTLAQAGAAVTPSQPTNSAGAAARTVPTTASEVDRALHSWAKAWSDRNVAQYIAAYDRSFSGGMASHGAWEQERRNRIVSKAHISVALQDVQIQVQGNRAVAKFRQDYRADHLAVQSRKTMELVKSADRWLIVKENTGN